MVELPAQGENYQHKEHYSRDWRKYRYEMCVGGIKLRDPHNTIYQIAYKNSQDNRRND